MKKAYQLLSVFIFMFFLVVPALKHGLYGSKVNNHENRKLTQIPTFPSNLTSLNDYTSQLDDFFKDQFGYRRIFIRAANKIRYLIFNEVTAKNITIGKNGFIFFNSHSQKHPNSLITSVCDVNKVTDKKISTTMQTYKKFIDYYTSKDIITTVAAIPLKVRIYPENLPDLETSWCNPNTPTWADVTIPKTFGKEFYYPLEKFKKWKKLFQVYLPTHFHWNGELPHKVAIDMMESIWHIKADKQATISDAFAKTDLFRNLDGLKFNDKSKKYQYKFAKTCYNCINNLKEIYPKGHSFEIKRKTKDNDRKLLIICDSFGFGVAKHFIMGFNEVIHININNLTQKDQLNFFQKIMMQEKPTHLLYLFNSGGLLNQSNRIKKLIEDLDSEPF